MCDSLNSNFLLKSFAIFADQLAVPTVGYIGSFIYSNVVIGLKQVIYSLTCNFLYILKTQNFKSSKKSTTNIWLEVSSSQFQMLTARTTHPHIHGHCDLRTESAYGQMQLQIVCPYCYGKIGYNIRFSANNNLFIFILEGNIYFCLVKFTKKTKID